MELIFTPDGMRVNDYARVKAGIEKLLGKLAVLYPSHSWECSLDLGEGDGLSLSVAGVSGDKGIQFVLKLGDPIPDLGEMIKGV